MTLPVPLEDLATFSNPIYGNTRIWGTLRCLISSTSLSENFQQIIDYRSIIMSILHHTVKIRKYSKNIYKNIPVIFLEFNGILLFFFSSGLQTTMTCGNSFWILVHLALDKISLSSTSLFHETSLFYYIRSNYSLIFYIRWLN